MASSDYPSVVAEVINSSCSTAVESRDAIVLRERAAFLCDQIVSGSAPRRQGDIAIRTLSRRWGHGDNCPLIYNRTLSAVYLCIRRWNDSRIKSLSSTQ